MNKNLPPQTPQIEQPHQPITIEMTPPDIQGHVETVPADVIPQKAETHTAYAALEAAHRTGSLAVARSREMPVQAGTHGHVVFAKSGGGFTQYRM